MEKLRDDCFDGGVHVFKSPPGGGKTTILRAFTPNALRAFWHGRAHQSESYRQFVDRGVLDVDRGPELLGVFLSSAAGYADLPPGASAVNEGLFRALFDSRVVMRTLRSLTDLLGISPAEAAENISLEYSKEAEELKSIPLLYQMADLIQWSEQKERDVYGQLDDILPHPPSGPLTHVRFESILWLQSVRFIYKGKSVAPRRLLMIDDIQRLRKMQRAMLIDELVVLRPKIPVWLASRTIAFGEEFLSQGARDGRDVREYALEEIWGGGRNQAYLAFAQNILDRRFNAQAVVPAGHFSHYLAETFTPGDLEEAYHNALKVFELQVKKHSDNIRYSEWISKAKNAGGDVTLDNFIDLVSTRILIARDESGRQLSLELAPLSQEEFDDRDSSAVRNAAEIFLNYELKIPYYFSIDRLCAMSTNNVEELLSLASSLYEGMKAKQVVKRQNQPQLTPAEQEKRLREAALQKRDFITRSQKDGAYARRLLDAIGTFCRDRTFLMNAPYAPGVTGVRLSYSELAKFKKLSKSSDPFHSKLYQVIFECVAENLLVSKESSSSTSREGGTVFYLNRTLCAAYGLPLQYGGWQETTIQKLSDWMENGLQPAKNLALEER